MKQRSALELLFEESESDAEVPRSSSSLCLHGAGPFKGRVAGSPRRYSEGVSRTIAMQETLEVAARLSKFIREMDTAGAKRVFRAIQVMVESAPLCP